MLRKSRNRGSKASYAVLQDSLLDNDESSITTQWTPHQLARTFETGVDVQDRTYRLRTYKRCFIGSEAVSYMVNTGLASSRNHAVQLGNVFMRTLNLFEHVCRDHEFKDSYLFYSFVPKKKRFLLIDPFYSGAGEEDYTSDSSANTSSDGPLESSVVEEARDIGAARDHVSLENICKRLERGVKVGIKRYRLKTYKDVFVGSTAVDWMLRKRLATSRREAVEIGQTLMNQFHLFEHCVDAAKPFKDDFLFYKFVPESNRRPVKHQTATKESEEAVDAKLVEVATIFKRGVKTQNNKYRGKVFRGTFVGSEAVDFLVNSSLAATRLQAVKLGRLLESEMNLFQHVSGKHAFTDDFLFYKFVDEQQRRRTGLSTISGLSNLSMSSLPLEKIAEFFRKGVSTKDRKYHFRTYKNCFVGSEAVDFLVGSLLAESRVEAIDLGRSLAREFDLFEHVTKDHIFEDKALFYRFINTGELRPISEIAIDSARLLEMAKRFEANVGLKDRRYGMRVYRNCFLGTEAVDFLVNAGMVKSRSEGVLIVREFVKQFNLVEHVARNFCFKDEGLFFRFVHQSLRRNWVEEDESMISVALPELDVQSEDEEWTIRVRKFEAKILAKSQALPRGLRSRCPACRHDADATASNRLKCWASELRRLDPRYQILDHFNEVARNGSTGRISEQGDANTVVTRPLLRYLFRASVFTVWRPTSFDAIRKMMLGEAVGKGLDIKGKSAKRGRLAGFVPFLQISENKHKRKIRTLPKHGTIRLFFKADARRGRDIVAEKLEEVAKEMMEVVKEARRVLSDDKADEPSRNDALESMLLDMAAPSISYIDEYEPRCYGLDVPVRLFWETFYARRDITRKTGSEYDIGRPSLPAFQDMNLSSLQKRPKEGAPRAVLMQNADPDSPMNPFELLMAYEQNGRVLPLVSDFDCFLLGTRGVAYSLPLPPDQLETLRRCISRIETILDNSSSLALQHQSNWTKMWLNIIRMEAEKEDHQHRMPTFGLGDPTSYSIMEGAIDSLKIVGAVRHGAESFNFFFPQELDDEFLIVSDCLPGNLPWTYVDATGLQAFLSRKIDEGFTFPLNVKWILCDRGWKALYDKLLSSNKKNVPESMTTWFPPESGVREQIEEIHVRHPFGLGRMAHQPQTSLRQSGAAALADLVRDEIVPAQVELARKITETIEDR